MAKVLVVDDVRFILEMVASIFRDQGHVVLTAEDGPSALETAMRERPDMILLDIAMPGMDGVEVARRLRDDPTMANTPILMVTSRSDSKSIARATEAGADDHVGKPFDTKVLLDKAAKLLGSYRMNLSVDEVGGVSVVTVLNNEMTEEIVENLDAALHAVRANGSPVVLDLGRVTKIDAKAADTIIRHADELRKEGRPVETVQPGRGIGTRTLVVRLEPHSRLHEGRKAALEGAGADPAVAAADAAHIVAEETDELGIAPPGHPDAPAPNVPPPASEAGPPVPEVTVDTIGSVLMVRVRRGAFSDALPEIRREVLALSERSVLLTMKGVPSIGATELGELNALARELQATGRSLRLVDPDASVAKALEDGGVGGLVVRKDPGEATRASS